MTATNKKIKCAFCGQDVEPAKIQFEAQVKWDINNELPKCQDCCLETLEKEAS